MATIRALATTAIILLVALSTSQIAFALRPSLGVCRASGYLPGKSGNCEKSNDPDCCEDGKQYPQYHCSPPVTASTKAVLTLNSFEKGKDGGGPSECDNAYHSDQEKVVALSTGWFSNMARCGHQIKITANGNSVYAKVVDECDSVHGCDDEHNFEPPCDNNIVDASPAVWDALGLDQNIGMVDITWSEDHTAVVSSLSGSQIKLRADSRRRERNMSDTRILVVFALLQVMCFTIREVSATNTTCHTSGFIHGKGRNCHKGNGLDNCCVAGKRYPQFKCSPPVSAKTPAILAVNRFENGADGAGMTSCDMRFHRNKELVVTLSSGWLRLDGTNRCNKKIRISANGRSVLAKVVDECDSVNGCDDEHDFEPPCRNNVVNGSPGVWKALRLNESTGELKVTWSDV
ncbi:hypothetical protein EJB05_56833, partial [Eragrostis curvula]